MKLRKLKKHNWKNWTVKKNWLNRLEFKKNWPVWFCFGFISLKLKKSNWTENKKNKKETEPNQFEPVFVLKNQIKPTKSKQVGLNRFKFDFSFFFLNLVCLFFCYKNHIRLKIITPVLNCLVEHMLKSLLELFEFFPIPIWCGDFKLLFFRGSSLYPLIKVGMEKFFFKIEVEVEADKITQFIW